MNQFDETYRKALAGDAEAKYNLALAYLEGEADPVQFLEWTKKAAETGHAKAMFNLALAYLKGEGTAADPVQYFEWIKKTAEAGLTDAMFNLAWAYLKGVGIPVDVDEYLTWVNKAAKCGHVHASMLNHAYCVLRDGEVNPTDILLSNIDKLLNAVNRIKQRHILDDGSIGKNTEIEIAHFTHFQTLEKMLPFKQGNPFPLPNHHFRLYNAEYLNDPHEGCRIFQHMKGYPEYS